MNSEDLKQMQAPLKDKYQKDPKAALITLKANGNIGEGISCKIDTGRALVEAGLHPATGGDGMLVCSGELLLEALVACAGVTLNAVATAMGVELESGEVEAHGDLDFRGTLAVDKDVNVGFTSIRLHFNLQTNADPTQISKLIQRTERYCVVLQTLTKGVDVQSNYSLRDGTY